MRRLNPPALSTLRFFDAAARLLSFTRAAQELRITQGAVSQHIKALEERLGCKLFFRLPGQIRLTDDGRRFAEVVTRSLQQLEAAAEMLVLPEKSRANVRLRASSSLTLRWLIPRLERLQARHPKIKLHLLDDDRYLDQTRWDFDLAIELTQAPAPDLHTEFLMDEYLTPVCSPEYLSSHPFLRTPASLARCTLLHEVRAGQSATEGAEWRYWLTHAGAAPVDSGHDQFFTSANLAIEAALAHQGVALGRLSLLEGPLITKKLVTPFPRRMKSPAHYYLAYARDLPAPASVMDLANWLHDEARRARYAYPHSSSRNNVGADGHGHASANMHSAVGPCSAFPHVGSA